jgi:hypothetical protein
MSNAENITSVEPNISERIVEHITDNNNVNCISILNTFQLDINYTTEAILSEAWILAENNPNYKRDVFHRLDSIFTEFQALLEQLNIPLSSRIVQYVEAYNNASLSVILEKFGLLEEPNAYDALYEAFRQARDKYDGDTSHKIPHHLYLIVSEFGGNL